MPSKARPAAGDIEKPAESNDTPPATTTASDEPDPKAAAKEPPAAGNDVAGAGAGEHPSEVDDAPRPGVYRFTWPYPCTYLLPDRTSSPVETGEEIFWPDGAPDALWEFVSADEPAPAPSDNTPRE